MTVGADGSLYPCHRFVGMQAWTIGNIYSGPDEERCKDFWRRYRLQAKQSCSGCWMWKLCHGPCPWEIASADGTFHAPDGCEHAGQHILDGLFFYMKKREGETAHFNKEESHE